jgi:hypothetical protein
MERGFKEAIFHITSSYRCRSSSSDCSYFLCRLFSLPRQPPGGSRLLPPASYCLLSRGAATGIRVSCAEVGRGLIVGRKEAASLPHQPALNLLLLPAMRGDEFAGRAPVTDLRIGLPWLARSSKPLVSCGAVMRAWRGRAPAWTRGEERNKGFGERAEEDVDFEGEGFGCWVPFSIPTISWAWPSWRRAGRRNVRRTGLTTKIFDVLAE